MSANIIVKSYAKALYESAVENKAELSVLNQMQGLTGLIKTSSEVQSFFASPVMSTENKLKTFLAAVQNQNLNKEIIGLINVMSDKNRLSLFVDVLSAYQEIIDENSGVIRGVVKSANVLSSEARNAIEAKIAKTLNKKIIINYEIDKTMIGGLIANVGGWTFDDSLNTHLNKMNEDLKRRVN